MKKLISIVFIIALGIVSSGCATWDGIKQDSSDSWDATKEVIHNATSD